jgi:hypothetical protein
MSDTQTPRSRRVPQKPVFRIEPFDPNNIEHVKGNLPIILNKALALQLAKFIRDSELSEDEGHIYAMQGHISRWYKDRFEALRKMKTTEQPTEPAEAPTVVNTNATEVQQ